MTDQPPLEPARPDSGEAPSAYMPHIPWKWVLGIGGFLALSIGTCQMREHQELEAQRLALREAYSSQLAPIVKRHAFVTEHIRSHTVAALAKPAERYVDARFKLDVLGSSPGLYLRVRADKAGEGDAIFADAASLPPDAIARCLGLAPADASELLMRGTFLEPSFMERTAEADSIMKLRVLAEELRQRSKRDLPSVVDALQAQWFLLVIERGESRHAGPVDVYLWDIRDNTLLLSERTQASGALVSARIAVAGVAPKGYADGAQTGAAKDCAIASSMRTLTGGAAPKFEATPPAPRSAIASVTDASVVAGARVEPTDAGVAPAPERAAPSAPHP